MDYYNMKEAKEIDFAIDYIKEIRFKYVDEIRAKQKELGEGVISDVVNRLASGIVDLENKEIDRLKNDLVNCNHTYNIEVKEKYEWN